MGSCNHPRQPGRHGRGLRLTEAALIFGLSFTATILPAAVPGATNPGKPVCPRRPRPRPRVGDPALSRDLQDRDYPVEACSLGRTLDNWGRETAAWHHAHKGEFVD